MKHQRNILKARDTKVSLIALRKQWLDKQKKIITNQNMIGSDVYQKIQYQRVLHNNISKTG